MSIDQAGPSAPDVVHDVLPETLDGGPVMSAPEDRPSSRRAFFMLGAAAAATALPGLAAAQSTRRPRPTIRPDRDPFPTVVANESAAAPAEWASDTVRLARRITMGVTAAETMAAKTLGYQAYLNRQLNYRTIDDSAVEAYIAGRYPVLAGTGEQMFATANITNQLQEATIYRAAFSRRQLYERMVEFWSDHFNIATDKVGYLKAIDDRDVIRKHALGKFGDLVMASAKSAAMLAYLDQNVSRVGRLNENYAREIMELHTVGVDGGYTQTDVVELARVLTGWTIAGRGNFVFNPALHDWGAKTVMGVSIPAGSPAMGQDGIKEGEQFITFLINHPNTARFIATKMLRWLLTVSPSEHQITTIAGVFTATKGDIKATVRAILNQKWVSQAPLKLKRPFHFLVSGLRALAPTQTNPAQINGLLNAVGQVLFDWETPDGYPDTVEYWAGNILPRWTAANTLANYTSGTTNTNVDVTRYLAGTPDAAVDLIDTEFFGGEMPLSTRNSLLTYARGAAFNATRARETLALAMSSSAFQWY